MGLLKKTYYENYLYRSIYMGLLKIIYMCLFKKIFLKIIYLYINQNSGYKILFYFIS